MTAARQVGMAGLPALLLPLHRGSLPARERAPAGGWRAMTAKLRSGKCGWLLITRSPQAWGEEALTLPLTAQQ